MHQIQSFLNQFSNYPTFYKTFCSNLINKQMVAVSDIHCCFNFLEGTDSSEQKKPFRTSLLILIFQTSFKTLHCVIFERVIRRNSVPSFCLKRFVQFWRKRFYLFLLEEFFYFFFQKSLSNSYSFKSYKCFVSARVFFGTTLVQKVSSIPIQTHLWFGVRSICFLTKE